MSNNMTTERITDIRWDLQAVRIETYDTTTAETLGTRYVSMTVPITERRVAGLVGARPDGTGAATLVELSHTHEVSVLERDHHAIAAMQQIAPRAQFVQGDAACERDVRRWMAQIAEKFNGLHHLICNAGDAKRPEHDTIRSLSVREFEELLRANLTTAFVPTKFGLECFSKTLQLAVFLGSCCGLCPQLGQLGYGTGKFGLLAMAKILALQERPCRFVVIRPGVVKTGSPNWLDRIARDQDWIRYEESGIPTKELGKPEQVAKLIAFLCNSDAVASQITGAELPLDGGLGISGMMHPAIDPCNARESFVRAVREWGDEQRRKAA